MTTVPASFAWTVAWANQNPSPVAKMMGFSVVELSPGHAVVAMEYRPADLEVMGIYSTGVLIGLADSAFMFAARTATDPELTLDPDRYPLVIQLSVNLVHNASHGRGTDSAKVLHSGRSTQVV